MTSDRLVLCVVLALPLINDLLKQKGPSSEDQQERPDLQWALGAWSRGVWWGFVGTGGFAWLAETGGKRARGSELTHR
jgi:hypothetical protein